MKKVLVIEDDLILQKALNEYLSEHGFDVMIASDGKTGIRMAKRIEPNIILLDLICPKEVVIKY